MSRTKKNNAEFLEEENAKVLAELLVDPKTTPQTQVQIINKLLEHGAESSFFDIMLEEQLDFGACPECGHVNNWLTPETELNQRGIVTSEKDSRVKNTTTEKDCPEFQEACAKKKVVM